MSDDFTFHPVDPESLEAGQVIWFNTWLPCGGETVTGDKISKPATYSATIETVELMSFQKGLPGKWPDIKQYYFTFEEGGEGMTLYVGEREYLNQRFWLDREGALSEVNWEKQESLKEAAENFEKAKADLEFYTELQLADVPNIHLTATDDTYQYEGVMERQAEIDGATQAA